MDPLSIPPKRLLIVDDERIQRMIIVRVVAPLGFAVDSAANLHDATAYLREYRYDAVILDLSLGDTEGISLLSVLRDCEYDPVLIFLSRLDQRVIGASLRLAASMGLRVAGMLRKPTSPCALRALLRDAPRRHVETDGANEHAPSAGDLASALEAGTIVPHFQPKISLRGGKVIGVEALARWPGLGHDRMPPDIFVPLAEQSGLIVPLTFQIMRAALEACGRWRVRYPDCCVAVNISPLVLADPTLPDAIERLLHETGLAPGALIAEITEGTVIANPVMAAEILTRLRIKGIELSIDDFGTGHSSLLALLRLPFSELKIDRSFVTHCDTDPEAWKIVRATISMARELGLRVVAEGIETAVVANMLRDAGCDVGQGWYFGRAMPEAELLRMDPGVLDGACLKRSIPFSAAVASQALLLLSILAVIWGVIWLHLATEYSRTVRNAADRTASLAQTLDENMRRSASVLDTALRNSRDLYLADPAHFKIGPWMRDRTLLLKLALQISVADVTGTVVTSSGDNGPPPINIADRQHFRVQVASDEDRLFISLPVIGRGTGRLSVQFSRRMINPDGSFAGVVVASFDPFVIDEFSNAARLNGGFSMLIGNDGVIRASQPETALIGTRFAEPAILAKFNAAGDQPLVDGTEKVVGDHAIVSYRKVAGYPLFVATGFPFRAILALYERERGLDLTAGAVLSLIVLCIGVIAIRDRRRLTLFHEALTLTLENISQGILMIDARRRVPVVNRRVAELLDLPAELARPGTDYDEIVEWMARRGEFRSMSAAALRTATLRGDPDGGGAFYERTRDNGTVLEVRTTMLPDGGAVRTFTDVTERKRIEADLARARDEAEAGVRARTEFLAVMSHEIRTPMNGIIGAAGLLRDMRLDTEQRDYVRIIRESSDHLSSLIQNILDFSRLNSGRLELDETAFDPRALIEGTIAMLSGEAQAKGLTLTAAIGAELPDSVTGDPSRLRQILVNLIGNGIKFTQSGGVIVETRVSDTDARTITIGIAVSDSGIGIDPESQWKLFSAFTQVDGSISRRFDGSGLGLAICKSLIMMMGGTIDVDSAPGLGSTFRFSIRFRHSVAGRSADALVQGAPAPVRPLKVLLAEDNPTNRQVATRMLIRMGHTVEAVEDGAQAVAAAAGGDYDVILMDMMMPEVDGLAATRTIRAGVPPRRDIRIVGLTANALASDRAACEAAGMNGFVTKPATLERLRAALEETVRGHDPVAIRSPNWASPALDAAFLSELAADIGKSCVVEIVRAFLEDAPIRMAAIKGAMEAGAIQTVRREAHALAGASRNVGLTRLGDAAYALQIICGQALPDAAEIEVVDEALRRTLSVATEWADANEDLAAPAM